jgi:hypothetical protein
VAGYEMKFAEPARPEAGGRSRSTVETVKAFNVHKESQAAERASWEMLTETQTWSSREDRTAGSPRWVHGGFPRPELKGRRA